MTAKQANANGVKNTSAGATGSEDINDLTWRYKFGDDGNGNVQQVEIALSREQALAVEGELVIPGEINGATVEVIGEGAFMDANQLTSVVLPVTTTRIESGAFYNNKNLEKVTIPNGVTHIGEGAFYNCTALRSITIPASVKSICMLAFADCGMLESITFLGEPPRLLREESLRGAGPRGVHSHSAPGDGQDADVQRALRVRGGPAWFRSGEAAPARRPRGHAQHAGGGEPAEKPREDARTA